MIARYDTGGVALSSALYDYRISNLIERYQAGPNSFLFRNRSAARIRGVELEARAALPHAFVVRVTALAPRGRDDNDGTPLDDIAPASISLVTRHSLRAVSSSFRVDRIRLARRRRAERSTDSRLLPGRRRRLLARDAPLQVVGTLRNLLNDSYYSSAGPRWVYAPGRHGTVTVVVGF